jgi:predicted HicB family RNase H-like nuclease
MNAIKRKQLNIGLRPDHFDAATAEAKKTDTSLTAWVRQLILAELKRLSK